jgi:hypothetical protein
VFHPADAALYAVSARKGSAGKISLYGVEGDGAGQWKDVGFDAFNSGYRLVDEDEGIAIRNLVPANVPVGDIRVVNVLYPITLLSSAVFSIGESVPTPSTIDPNKLAEQRQGMLEGVLSAIIFVTEAIDVAGVAYDAIRIGKNTLNMIRETALHMLVYLNGILKTISQSTDLAAIKKAAAIAESFMTQAPLWGLYLDRAYLWTQSSDLAEMTRVVQEARQVDGTMYLVLGAIEKKRDFLLKNGISPEQMAEAKAYAETVLRNAKDAQGGVDAYLTRTKTSEKSLQRAKFAMDKYLDINADKIKALMEENGTVGDAALGDYFIGVLGQRGPQRALPEHVEIVRLMRAVTSNALKSGRTMTSEIRPLAIEVILRLLNLANGNMNSLALATRAVWATGVKETNIKHVLKGIRSSIAEIFEKLNEEKSKPNPDPKEIARLEITLVESEKALRIAQMDSSLLELNHVNDFIKGFELNKAIRDIPDEAVPADWALGPSRNKDPLYMIFNRAINTVFGGNAQKSILVELDTPEQRAEFISIMRDMQAAFDLSPNATNVLVHKLVDGTIVPSGDPAGKKGRSVRRRSAEEVQELIKTIYDESNAMLEAEYANLVRMIDAETAAGLRSYARGDKDVSELIKEVDNPSTPESPFARMTSEQREAIKKLVSPSGDFVRTYRFVKELQGELEWPEGVVNEISKLIHALPAMDLVGDTIATSGSAGSGAGAKVNLSPSYVETYKNFRAAKKELAALNKKILDEKRKPTKGEADEIGTLNEAINVLKGEIDTEAAAREDASMYRRLQTALLQHNEDIARRKEKAANIASDTTAFPELKAAGKDLETATAAEENAAVAVDTAVTNLAATPGAPVTPAVEAVVAATVTTEAAAVAAEHRVDATVVARAVAAREGAPGGPGEGTGGDHYTNASTTPTAGENTGRESVASARATAVGSKTALKKTLYGLGAAVAIAALLGLGAALSGRATPDPKSTDPIVPPPVSNVEKALKIGGAVAGGALLLYLLFGRRQESKTPAKAQLKR